MTIPRDKERSRLLKCLVISVAVHVAALSYYYFHPWILSGSCQSLFGMTSAEPTALEADEEALALQKNHLLEEVFESIVVLSPHFQKPYDMVELAQGMALAPNQEETERPSLVSEEHIEFSKPHSDFSYNTAIALDLPEFNLPMLFHAPELGAPIASQLQVDGPEMTAPEFLRVKGELDALSEYDDMTAISSYSLEANYEADDALSVLPRVILEDLELKADLAAQSSGIETDLSFEEEEAPTHLYAPKNTYAAESKGVSVSQPLSDLDDYNFSDLLNTSEWNDDFDVDVTFLPNSEGEGYIFSLSLKSNYDLSSYSLKQNLYFILDRSSTIQKHRFDVFKRATLKALASMQRSDSFNILLIDKKITRFRPENCVASLKNIQAAEDFLDKQEAGGPFATADIYSKIETLLPFVPNDDDEMHTAILLTDGKTAMNAERKYRSLKKWIHENDQRVALYACAIGRDNDLASLDMLSSVSGGKLLYSDTHASFPRKLAKLVLDLKDPIAKELTLEVVPHNPDSHVELFSPSQQLATLYSHQPYVISGQIDHPCSFDLIVQGRHRDQWIAIKKTVSFIDGRKGDVAFQKKWKSEHANVCYSKFLEEGKAAYLKQAKEILKASRSEVAFD